jgi:D-glycero-alpha-D-manno-heptose-7-phosphate kinase
MIISRSPLRISLGGGGTDIPSFYQKHDGFVMAAAINKYVYTSIIEPYANGFFLKYSSLEKVKNINKIKHPIIREVLLKYKLNIKRIEITTLADIPSGTGLGSSGSFTNSLIKALYAFNNRSINTERLSEESCDIEINRLKNPVGKQDQYISAYGGIKNFVFKKNNKVIVSNTKISKDTFFELEDNLLLFFTGFTRSSSTILKKQDVDSKKNIHEMIENLKKIKKMGLEAKKLIENNDLKKYGELMNYHWKKKIERSKNITNKKINYIYEEALKSGAIGGKLVGAGGGGFLMFYAHDKTALRKKMLNLKVEELIFKFDTEGTKII